jgi:hypothetical protein
MDIADDFGNSDVDTRGREREMNTEAGPDHPAKGPGDTSPEPNAGKRAALRFHRSNSRNFARAWIRRSSDPGIGGSGQCYYRPRLAAAAALMSHPHRCAGPAPSDPGFPLASVAEGRQPNLLRQYWRAYVAHEAAR